MSYLVENPEDRFSCDEAHKGLGRSVAPDLTTFSGAVWFESAMFAIPSALFGCIII